MNHMKRRHSGHMNNGGGRGGHHRPRHQGGGGGFQRPRKNYAAMREQYVNKAREAMSRGDRVLAEYYLQHADHCYRMQQEFMAERNARQQSAPNAETAEEAPMSGISTEEAAEEINLASNSSVLPAFLTQPSAPAAGAQPPAPPPNWDEE